LIPNGGWRPDLEIREKDDPEVNRVDPISESDGTDEGDDDGQCREHTHDATHSEEKEIHDHQEKEGAADTGLEESSTFMGISSSIKQFVKPRAAPRMIKIPPTNTMLFFMIPGSSFNGISGR